MSATGEVAAGDVAVGSELLPASACGPGGAGVGAREAERDSLPAEAGPLAAPLGAASS